MLDPKQRMGGSKCQKSSRGSFYGNQFGLQDSVQSSSWPLRHPLIHIIVRRWLQHMMAIEDNMQICGLHWLPKLYRACLGGNRTHMSAIRGVQNLVIQAPKGA